MGIIYFIIILIGFLYIWERLNYNKIRRRATKYNMTVAEWERYQAKMIRRRNKAMRRLLEED